MWRRCSPAVDRPGPVFTLWPLRFAQQPRVRVLDRHGRPVSDKTVLPVAFPTDTPLHLNWAQGGREENRDQVNRSGECTRACALLGFVCHCSSPFLHDLLQYFDVLFW